MLATNLHDLVDLGTLDARAAAFHDVRRAIVDARRSGAARNHGAVASSPAGPALIAFAAGLSAVSRAIFLFKAANARCGN